MNFFLNHNADKIAFLFDLLPIVGLAFIHFILYIIAIIHNFTLCVTI